MAGARWPANTVTAPMLDVASCVESQLREAGSNLVAAHFRVTSASLFGRLPSGVDMKLAHFHKRRLLAWYLICLILMPIRIFRDSHRQLAIRKHVHFPLRGTARTGRAERNASSHVGDRRSSGDAHLVGQRWYGVCVRVRCVLLRGLGWKDELISLASRENALLPFSSL